MKQRDASPLGRIDRDPFAMLSPKSAPAVAEVRAKQLLDEHIRQTSPDRMAAKFARAVAAAANGSPPKPFLVHTGLLLGPSVAEACVGPKNVAPLPDSVHRMLTKQPDEFVQLPVSSQRSVRRGLHQEKQIMEGLFASDINAFKRRIAAVIQKTEQIQREAEQQHAKIREQVNLEWQKRKRSSSVPACAIRSPKRQHQPFQVIQQV